MKQARDGGSIAGPADARRQRAAQAAAERGEGREAVEAILYSESEPILALASIQAGGRRPREKMSLSPLALALAAALLVAPLPARAQVPTWPVTWVTNRSTYWYSCRQDAQNDPSLATNWSIINIDWSNEKDIWAKEKPMRCEERLFEQAQAFKAARPPWARSWVYRNTCKALPWYSTVRSKLVDPAYAPWFLRFGPNATVNGTYWSPPCDPNYDPPLCSDLYHDSVCQPDEQAACQVPGYPTGDGVCDAPACDVGAIPVGEYVWDPRAWNMSVNGQTLGEWWIEEYLFGEFGAGNQNISGFFFDVSIAAPPSDSRTPLF